MQSSTSSETVTNIGSRRELFVDRHLIESLQGATLQLQHPVPQEIAITHDAPWEGNGSGYHSIFKDGDIYRMYYKGWQMDVTPGKVAQHAKPRFYCYAESDDGIHWRKPELGVVDFEGSTANNILYGDSYVGEMKLNAAHSSTFRDTNPNCAPDALYKTLIRTHTPTGLVALKSADGLTWTRMSDKPVITSDKFDSQNLAFWDAEIGQYRAYWRYFANEGTDQSYRAIRTAVSDDFLHWHDYADLQYVDSPNDELYTNAIKPYHRAPHLLLGFPARYVERGWSESMWALPELQQRQWRADDSERYGTAISDGMFMASRDGVTFNRWNEAFLRPGPQRPGTWNYGHQYIAWHLLETPSKLPGAANELSLYAVESYWTGAGGIANALRRYTLRLDGFVAANAPASGGSLTTKPLQFSSNHLHLNFATSAAGQARLEIQDKNGTAIDGYSLEDCDVIFGDSTDRVISWKGNKDVSTLAGQAVKLHIEMQDADVYSFWFGD